MNTSQCRTCRQLILFARHGEEPDRWVVLEPQPTPYHQVADAHDYRVVDGAAAYTAAHMRERLQFAEFDRGPVEDFPWHRIHRCETHQPTGAPS